MSVFCAVFFSLAVGFGLSYIRERDAGILYKNVNDGRAYASLCEYMISMGNVLRRIEGLQHENKYILAVEYSYLAGGAKAILASLPFEESARKRLQTYFSESDGYIRSLISDKIDDEINIDIISGYISYNDKISKKLIEVNEKSEALGFETKLSELQIDTPPAYPENTPAETGGEYVSASVNKITEKQAKEIARGYLGDYLSLQRRETDGNFFRFSCGSAFIDILKAGGKLVRLSSGRICRADKIKLSGADACILAEKFINEAGIKNIAITDERVYAGRYEAEYAPAESGGGDRKIYIGVSLDTGKISYYDASDYYNIKQ